jgi:hypothetical protein
MTEIPVTITRRMLNWPAMASLENAVRCNPNSGLVLHWDGAGGLVGKPHTACVNYWRRTRDFHINSRGWVCIGYAWGVCPHGGRLEGRGWGWIQAAQPGGNSTWESCTLMLGPGEMPTPEQITGVRRLRADLMEERGLKADIRPHSRFVSTDCPGPIISRMITDGTFSLVTPSPNWTEKLVDSLPTISENVTSYDVKTVRALLYARGWLRTLVGHPEFNLVEFLDSTAFDWQLTSVVQQFQASKGLNADGIVGPLTWAKLLRR